MVIQAFADCHDGFSSDEVILNDKLNEKFIAVCQQQLPDIEMAKFNWTLINCRKAGKLKRIETSKRNNKSTTRYRVLAEMVSRSMLDQTQQSIDRIFCARETRNQFNQKALEVDPKADLYLVRKAAFQLRKSRRLKPELITRIADWGREIAKHSIDELKQDPSVVPALPGIYIFHDSSGYLYIGQSENLRKRLA